MRPEEAAVIANAEDLARWAAEAVLATDALIEESRRGPLSHLRQLDNLLIQRELLVRLSQQGTLLGWATEVRAARVPAPRPGILERLLARLRRRIA